MAEPQRIPTAEAARLLGVSIRTVQRLARSGVLPSERTARDYVFDARDVELHRLRTAQPVSQGG
jgi:excisionase family DNA binding protein